MKWSARSRIGKFFAEHAIQTFVVMGIASIAFICLIGLKQGQGSEEAIDLGWWPLLLLLIPLYYLLRSKKLGEWGWGKTAIALVVLAILTLPVYVVYKMNDEINRERDGKSSLVNRPTSSGVASRTTTSPSSVLLKAGSEWSEWSTMPLDMKASFLAARKGLVIMFRDVSGGEATVWDDPEKKVDLTALGVMAEAVAFRVRSETGDLPFTVHYTPKGG